MCFFHFASPPTTFTSAAEISSSLKLCTGQSGCEAFASVSTALCSREQFYFGFMRLATSQLLAPAVFPVEPWSSASRFAPEAFGDIRFFLAQSLVLHFGSAIWL